MTFLAQLLGLPILTLAATLESLLAIKLFPDYYAAQLNLFPVFIIFGANYGFAAVFWLLIYPKLLSPLRNMPGPRSVFSLAQRTLLITDRPPGDMFLDIARQYPGESMLNLSAFDKQILITKPEVLPELLVHRSYEFVKPTKIGTFLRHILGDGLIIAEGNQHRFLRKNTMPAFTFRHIKDLYPMMWAKAILFTETLRAEALDVSHGGGKGSGVLDLQPWASRVTLDIIGIAGLGRKFNMLQKSEDPLLKIYEGLTDPSMEKLTFAMASIIFGISLVQWLPWRMNTIFRNLTSSLNKICTNMIQEKRRAIEMSKDDHFDILSLLIKSDNFADNELKDQLLTFLAAGHETTASALTWSCYLLAKHPDIQQQLREEVRDALGAELSDDKGDYLGGTLEQLPYLNGVIHETLRLYPTVPMTMRQAAHDTSLGGQPIPKDTVIVLSIWFMNRSPELWGADAEKFRPERWISDTGKPNQNGGASSNYEFLTFLHGPRSCIGQGFAKAEMRCLLAAMVGSFSWELGMDEDKILPRGVITIKPANGLHLKLKSFYK